jgi:sarcosine oxidase, subunit beta
MPRTDVTVIGAGLFGTTLAVRLAQTGMRVKLRERTMPASGDTARSFGMVRRHYSNEVTVRLARRGCELLASWPEAMFVPTGYLLTVGPDHREACERNVALGRRLGVDSRLVEADELAAIEPLLETEGVACAAYEPDGGLVDAGKVALAAFGAALAEGVEVEFGPVDRLPEDGSTVVVSAGCWSPELLPELPVTLRRIEIAVLDDAPVRTVVSDAVSNVVVRPEAGGGAWAVAYAGETLYERRDDCDGEPDPAYVDAVRRALGERYPSVAGAPYRRGWAGVYDNTPDWNPVVGWVRDGVYAIAGLSGHGLKLAPAVAECVAAQLGGEEPPIDLRPLRFERFAEGDPLDLAYGPGARA